MSIRVNRRLTATHITGSPWSSWFIWFQIRLRIGFLTRSKVTLMLLARTKHSENHCSVLIYILKTVLTSLRTRIITRKQLFLYFWHGHALFLSSTSPCCQCFLQNWRVLLLCHGEGWTTRILVPPSNCYFPFQYILKFLHFQDCPPHYFFLVISWLFTYIY